MIVLLRPCESTKNWCYPPSTPALIKWFILFFCVFGFIKAYANNPSTLSGRLPNGLSYFIHHNPNSKKYISLDFIVRAGSANELENEKGFSHLIEHLISHDMKFKNIKIDDPSCPIWDLSYPDISEFSSYTFTQYHMDVSLGITDGLAEGLKSFSSILAAFPTSTQDFIESKEEILEEISETYNSPTKKWEAERVGHEYPSYKNKHPLGSPYCISQATRKSVYDFYRKWYHPNQSAIIVVGNISPFLVELLILHHFNTIPGSPHIDLPATSTLDPTEYFVYVDSELTQIELTLTKILPPMSNEQSLMFSIWTHQLQHHLAPHSPQIEILSYPPMLRLKFFFPKEDYQNRVQQLQNALKSFYDKAIDLDEFNTLKTQVEHAVLTQLQNDQYLSGFYRDLFVSQSANAQLPSEQSFEAVSLEGYQLSSKEFTGFSQVSFATSQEPHTNDVGDSHDH